MCFSAEASFIGGAVVITAGVAAVRSKQYPSQLLFALIPIFFGIQQITEGVVWLSVANSGYLIIQKVSTLTFLFFADVFWPTYIPLSILLMEKNRKRKKLMIAFLFLGIIVSLFYISCLFQFEITPEIDCYHIHYAKSFPKLLGNIALAIYIIATMSPLFLSTVKRLPYFGGLMFVAGGIAAIFYTYFFTSVWCFFAAIASVVILWIIKNPKSKMNSNSDTK